MAQHKSPGSKSRRTSRRAASRVAGRSRRGRGSSPLSGRARLRIEELEPRIALAVARVISLQADVSGGASTNARTNGYGDLIPGEPVSYSVSDRLTLGPNAYGSGPFAYDLRLPSGGTGRSWVPPWDADGVWIELQFGASAWTYWLETPISVHARQVDYHTVYFDGTPLYEQRSASVSMQAVVRLEPSLPDERRGRPCAFELIIDGSLSSVTTPTGVEYKAPGRYFIEAKFGDEFALQMKASPRSESSGSVGFAPLPDLGELSLSLDRSSVALEYYKSTTWWNPDSSSTTQTTAGLYWSEDAVYDAGDTLAYQWTDVTMEGVFKRLEADVGTPPPAARFLIGRVDTGNALVEMSELNNWVATPLPRVPDAPTDVVGAPGNERVKLTWTEPEEPVTNYVIEMSSKDAMGWSPWTALESYSPTTPSQTITGLTNGTEYKFRVAAENSAGRSEFSVETPPLKPRSIFVIEKADGAPFETFERDGETFSRGSGTIYVGRNDGISQMLRLEGDVEFNDLDLVANGVVYRTIGQSTGRETPLFAGRFTIDLSNGQSKEFMDSSRALPDQYEPGGLDIDFSAMAINAESLGFTAAVRLPEELGLPADFVLHLNGANGLIFTRDDVRLGDSGTVTLPAFNDIKLFNFVPIKEFSGFSIEYSGSQDFFRLQGKLALEFDAKSAEEGGAATAVTADLAGDNYLQIQGGKADVKGVLTIERLPLPKQWELEELRLAIDTVNRDLSAVAKLKFPFAQDVAEVVGTVDIKLPPPALAVNRLSIRVDDLAIPLPVPAIPGLKLTGFRGSLDNIAASDPDPLEFGGGISLSQGPKVVVPPWKIPGLGIDFAGGEFQTLAVDLDGKVNDEQAVGMFTATMVHEKIVRSTGEATIRWVDPGYMEFKGQTSLFDGWIKASKSFKIDSSLNVSMSDVVDVAIPDFVPVIGGKQVGSGVFELRFTNDGTLSNDYVAAWRSFRVQELGMDFDFSGGVKVTFDGRIQLVGSRTIPVTGSWDLVAGTEWVLLSADWQNSAANVPLRIKKPDGTWIEEANFAAHDIAVVDVLSDTTTKVVILKSPTAGHWDLAVADSTGLGTVTYTALERAVQPTIEFPSPPSPAIVRNGGDVAVAYSCVDPDSTATVRFFYDTDRSGFDGIPISGDLPENDAAGTFTWRTGATPAGEYVVYAMVTDGEGPPVFRYAPGTVRIVSFPATHVNQAPAALVLSNASIAENNAVGAVVGTLSATDPDAGDWLIYSLVPGEGSADNGSFTIDGAQLKAAASFDFETSGSHSIRVKAIDLGGLAVERQFTITVTNAVEDFTTPVLVGVASPPAGTYPADAKLLFTALFDEPVTVAGQPAISFTGIIGGAGGKAARLATYESGTGTSQIVFSYLVAAGESAAKGLVVTAPIQLPPGASLADLAGNATGSLTFTPPTAVAVKVDGSVPVLTKTIGPAGKKFRVGEVLSFSVSWSENVVVTGSPRLLITVGSAAREAVYARGSGSKTLKFNYVAAAGDNGGVAFQADAIALAGGTVRDSIGNPAGLVLKTVNLAKVAVDVAPPTVFSVALPAIGGYVKGKTATIGVTFSEAVKVKGRPTLAVTFAPGVTRTFTFSKAIGGTVLFTLKFLADEEVPTFGLPRAITLAGGASIRDAVGNAADLSLPAG